MKLFPIDILPEFFYWHFSLPLGEDAAEGTSSKGVRP